MWQRFTERARRVVFYAQEEAQTYGEGYVSTEHLLLGLVRDNDGTSTRVLEALGVNPLKIQEDVRKQLPRGDARPNQDMTLTPRAKKVIDLSYDEARNLNNNYIGTEHLLLGLIKEANGLAGRVLSANGVSLELARRAVLELQDPNRVEPGPVPQTNQWKYQNVMNHVRDMARWAAELNREKLTLPEQLVLLNEQLEATLSELQRNQLLALCLEMNEGGSLLEIDRYESLRITKEQAEAMATIGGELRKLMDC